MENPQIIALVAIAISVISMGLVVANVFNLQTTLINLNTSVVEQSQTVKSLNQQQNATQQVIEEQRKSIMKMQDNIANLTSEIKSLEDRVTSLEQRLQPHCLILEGCPPPTPQKPVYFPGVVKFYNVAGGDTVGDNRVLKKLPSTLPVSGWIADFDYKFTASYIPSFLIFVLSTTSEDPQSQIHPNLVYVEHGGFSGADALDVEGTLGTISTPIPISPNVQYYVELDKTPTLLTLHVFSDPARTIEVPGSPQTLAILTTDYSNNLNYIQHDGCLQCGSARTFTAQIDNTKIYAGTDGSKQILFEDDYSSGVGWTQIGSSVAVNGSFIPQMPLPPIYEGLQSSNRTTLGTK